MNEMHCKRCGASENRIHGFCSIECENLYSVEEDRDELQQRVGTLENIIENYKTVLDANKEKLKECEDEILKLRGRVIEIHAKAASFKERAIHAEMTVLRMLKWGKKYVSEAWNEHDERVERKQAWDEIIAKFTDMEEK